ncbi:MAG: NCS2 family permease [Spirochaetota bacterium]|nr:NCS2 family permease [Spirochaetota bacterium]
MDIIARFFQFKDQKTNFKTEIIAGITTFFTMAYIIIVNPAILQSAGMPFGPSMVATIISAVFGTLIMGVYAKRPFAIAPYMGENAFIVFTVVNVLGYTWQVALGAIFISGILFTILTVTKIRGWMVEAIPMSLKYSFSAGIGLFLTFIGLNLTGIVKVTIDIPSVLSNGKLDNIAVALGSPEAVLHLGNLNESSVLLAIFSFIITSIMMIWRVKGAILLGIVITTFLAFPLGIIQIPKQWVSLPPSLSPIFLELDILGSISIGGFNIILIVFIMAFVDTIGTLIGLSARAGFLDKDGNLPQIEKPMMADALTTTFAALIGTTTSGAYIESSTGIEAGGKTGFTAIVVAILFLSALFFSPFFIIIPPQAYGPALIIIGLLMLSTITKINFEDYTESIPAFTVVVLISFTYNIGVGITGGFILYPFFKVISGKHKDINPGLWVLSALSLLFFIFYPY